MNRLLFAALFCASASTSAWAQSAPAAAPSVPAPAPAAAALAPAPAPASQPTHLLLPANSALLLSLNSGVSTKTFHAGDKFSLTVAQDVMAGNHVVIPHGARALGQVNWAKGNGSFGKSGKIELVFRYVEVGGKDIPIDGRYYQEGSGNTAGTIGAVLGAGIVGGLIVHGHSAEVPEGKEFNATTLEGVPFEMSDANSPAVLAPDYKPAPVSMQVETEKERKARIKQQENATKG